LSFGLNLYDGFVEPLNLKSQVGLSLMNSYEFNVKINDVHLGTVVPVASYKTILKLILPEKY
jgi:hypothetical protein